MTDGIFFLLNPKALLARPIPERHRVLFYIGHLEAFDWNLLGRTMAGASAFDKVLDSLFAFGIDPLDDGLPQDSPQDWPSREEVAGYVGEARRRTDALLAGGVLSPQVVEVAIEHRLMHSETLAYMLHWLPLDMKRRPAARPDSAPLPSLSPAPVTVPAGTATLGMSRADGVFGWDNEFETRVVHVPEFTIDRGNVTNREFLEFVRSGGYGDRALWTNADWAWRSEAGVEHPKFWERSGDRWLQRTMFDVRPLPEDWPVLVSHAEASAYARWRDRSLPTEAQFHRAAFGTPQGLERAYPWGDQPPDSRRGNFGSRLWDPTPVGSFPDGRSTWGICDLLGNGWEWTSTIFRPFDGFRRFDFYPGYSANFFDGRHFVMKGGSWRTPAALLRRSFRNWFQPHYPHLYATFRCVRS